MRCILGILLALANALFTHQEAASISTTVGTMTYNMYLKSKNILKLLLYNAMPQGVTQCSVTLYYTRKWGTMLH